MYVYQEQDWPQFYWDEKSVNQSLLELVSLQSQLLGKLEALGFDIKEKTALETGVMDVMHNSEIEGELFLESQIRSSIAKNLGIQVPEPNSKSEEAEGAVNMFLDVTRKYNKPLIKERMFDWHAGLFPTGRSAGIKIEVANWRTSKEPMQIVSGAMGKERVHYEALSSHLVPLMMDELMRYINDHDDHPFIKSSITHLWFEVIHPFDDGNGRIGRALVDKLLCEADKSELRFYSFSNAILQNKKTYYAELNKASRANLNVTGWLLWFFEILKKAIENSEKVLSKVDFKRQFWQKYAEVKMNDRQLKVLKKLVDGFEGKITSSKWTRITKCTKMTATRDINDLINKGILSMNESGGRSTSYSLNSEL